MTGPIAAEVSERLQLMFGLSSGNELKEKFPQLLEVLEDYRLMAEPTLGPEIPMHVLCAIAANFRNARLPVGTRTPKAGDLMFSKLHNHEAVFVRPACAGTALVEVRGRRTLVCLSDLEPVPDVAEPATAPAPKPAGRKKPEPVAAGA